MVLSLVLITASAWGIPIDRAELSLDGTWDIIFDHQNEGHSVRWHLDSRFSQCASVCPIEVPSCWELTEKDYEGVAFYRRRFTVPATWQGKVVRLHFDAVNFRAEIWVNDTAVGVHEGGFTPFAFRIDDLLTFDTENTLILRVMGAVLMQDKRIDGIGKMETPQWRGAIAGGIWQPVRLIATGETYVKDVFIEPRITDNSATFHLELEHTGEKGVAARVEVTIHAQGQTDRIVSRTGETVDLQPGTTAMTSTH